ncbi:hypothetical protein L2E82_02943 [Cichorium intybus]|uniref:Uncharacterized protein n=1 Tax=Cichorium intybus TaxID=13427 RepID=A0ACB9H3M9_CICIN|nr:hypothetical protein L2E82_02943 [Cichorium intybus]
MERKRIDLRRKSRRDRVRETGRQTPSRSSSKGCCLRERCRWRNGTGTSPVDGDRVEPKTTWESGDGGGGDFFTLGSPRISEFLSFYRNLKVNIQALEIDSYNQGLLMHACALSVN